MFIGYVEGSPFILVLALFDTTSRALGVHLNRGWRRAWASHPSEDLSEPSPLRDPCGVNPTGTVAGRKYHYRRIRSWRDSLPLLFFCRGGPLAPCLAVFYEKSEGEKKRKPSLCFPQVVLAHPRIARLSADVIQLPDIQLS